MNPFKRSISNLELIHFGRDAHLSQADQQRYDQLFRIGTAEKAHQDEITKIRSLLAVMPYVEPRKDFTISAHLAGVRPPKPVYLFAIRSSIALFSFFFIGLSLYRFSPVSTPIISTSSAEIASSPAMEMQAEPMALSAPMEEVAPEPMEDTARIVSPTIEADTPLAKSAPSEVMEQSVSPAYADWAVIAWGITLVVLIFLLILYPALSFISIRKWKKRNL